MKRALCPFCNLPRAMVGTIATIPIVSCECVTGWTLHADLVRAIPMTENHDPGDEERT